MTGTAVYYIPSEEGQRNPRSDLSGRIKIEEAWDESTNTSVFRIITQAKYDSSHNRTTWFTRGELLFGGDYYLPTDTRADQLDVTAEWTDIAVLETDPIEHESDGSLRITITLTAKSGDYEYYCAGESYDQDRAYAGLGDYTLDFHKNSVGLAHIDTGAGFESYSVWIDDGNAWAQYVPYIDTGSEWVLCG